MRTAPRLAFVVFGALGAVLLIVLALPLLSLAAAVDGASWIDVFEDPRTMDALWTSATTSLASTVLMAVFGVPLGYVLAKGRMRIRQFLIGLIVVPMVMPGLAGGIVLLQTFGVYSPIGSALADVGISFVGTPAGIVLAQTYVSSPFVVISAMMAFIGVAPQVEAAAATLGDSPWHVFRRVSMPLAWPGIAAGLVLGWMRALGEFGATMIVAYNPKTLPVYLWVRFESRGLTGALPVALILVILAGVTVIVWKLLGRLASDDDSRLIPSALGPRT